MDILVRELTDVTLSAPNRQELELDVELVKKDKVIKDGGVVTTFDDLVALFWDVDAAMTHYNAISAVVAGTIAIIMQ